MSSISVITGAGSGIGRALTVELAGRGCRVLAVGRRIETLEETQALAPQLIDIYVADITDAKQRQGLIEASKAYENVTHLVHNAGMGEPIGELATIDLALWRQHMATNLEAPVFLTQGFVPLLRGGRVLHISSALAHFPMPGTLAYCTSKAALFMVYQTLKMELVANQIAMGSVQPGIVDTEMQAAMRENTGLRIEDRNYFQAVQAAGYLIAPQTTAKFLAWLLCDLDPTEYSQQEWDIYDTRHHSRWLLRETVPPRLLKSP